jgi:uncharacterized protein (TIGR03118 family)
MRSGLIRLRRLVAKDCRARKPASVRPVLETLEARLVLSANFVQTNLVSDIPGMAATTDANLKNPWGLTAASFSPWWVANQGTGTSTLYTGQGVPFPAGSPLTVNVPGPSSVNGTPTGVVFNTSGTGFTVSEGSASGSAFFLFDGLDGTISGWNPTVNLNNALVEVTQPGAVFTGLAIAQDASGRTLLYAADFKNGVIDVFDDNFTQVTTLRGNFTDPNLPAGFSPFNIQNIHGILYVEYDKVDPTTGLPAPGPGTGIVDVFNTDGTLNTSIGKGGRLITGGPLNDPWGVALAPADFGPFSNDLLVGNFGDGHINAFNPRNGNFVAELVTSSGKPFEEDHLWSLQFGNGQTAGAKNTLFFTAGINNQADGLFGSLQAEPKLPVGSPIVPNLGQAVQQTVTTVPKNGDLNPYGVAFVPQNYTGGGNLKPGDILVSNFNNSSNIQGTGSTIVKISPDGQHSVFFQGTPGEGLNTALGVLPQGFVLVGNTPSTVQNGTPTVQNGSLLIIDSSGHQVDELTDSALLQGPWDLTIDNVSSTEALVFVSNVLSGTVTRIDFTIAPGGTPQVQSETKVASGYAHGTNPAALVLGPTGLAFDAKTGTLYVASAADNAIFAIANAAKATKDQGMGKLVTSDAKHLNGPLGLALAPNGDLIAANGDAFNPNSKVPPNLLLEFTPQGTFVGQFQLDTGAAGAGFGLALQSVGTQIRFAAVDDGTNTLQIFTLDPTQQPSDGGSMNNTGVGMPAPTSLSTAGGQVQQGNASMGMPPSPPQSNGGGSISQIDAFFQAFNSMLRTLEEMESSMAGNNAQIDALFQEFNSMLGSLESRIAGHPLSI